MSKATDEAQKALDEAKALQKKIEDLEKRHKELLDPYALEKAKLEKQKEVVDARANLRKAQLGTPTVAAPTGKTTAVTMKFEIELQTWRAVEKMSTTLAEEFKSPEKGEKNKKIVLIVGDRIDSPIHLLDETLASLDELAGLYELWLGEANRPAPPANLPRTTPQAAVGPAVLPALSGAVRSVADLVSLFRIERDYKASDVTLDATGLTALVARKLRGKRVDVHAPQSAPPPQGGLSEKLAKTRALVQDATKKIAEITADDAPTDLAKQAKAELTALNKRWTDLSTAVSKPVAANEPSLLEHLVQAQMIKDALSPNGEYDGVLVVQPVKAGGTQQTRRGLFARSDKLSFTGGAVLAYALFGKDAQILQSNVITGIEGPTPIESIANS